MNYLENIILLALLGIIVWLHCECFNNNHGCPNYLIKLSIICIAFIFIEHISYINDVNYVHKIPIRISDLNNDKIINPNNNAVRILNKLSQHPFLSEDFIAMYILYNKLSAPRI